MDRAIGLTFLQVLSPPHNVSDHDPVCAIRGSSGMNPDPWSTCSHWFPAGMPFLMSSAWGLTLGAAWSKSLGPWEIWESEHRMIGNPKAETFFFFAQTQSIGLCWVSLPFFVVDLPPLVLFLVQTVVPLSYHSCRVPIIIRFSPPFLRGAWACSRGKSGENRERPGGAVSRKWTSCVER